MDSSQPPIKILLVDDEAYFRGFVSRVLCVTTPCDVVTANDGTAAVKAFREEQPALVILDINMPRMDGVQALRAIRQVSGDVPIFMLTSVSEEAVVEECVEGGATFFIRKDVRADILREELQNALKEFMPGIPLTHEQQP